jgi:hypothetical protein
MSVRPLTRGALVLGWNILPLPWRAERSHFRKRLELDLVPVFLDGDFVLTQIGDRLTVAIEREQIQLDHVAGRRRRLRRLRGDSRGEQCDEQRRGESPHGAAAFRITAIAVAVTPYASRSAIGTHRTPAASVPCAAAVGVPLRTRHA